MARIREAELDAVYVSGSLPRTGFRSGPPSPPFVPTADHGELVAVLDQLVGHRLVAGAGGVGPRGKVLVDVQNSHSGAIA